MDKIKRLTVGDNSGLNRRDEHCILQRKSLAGIEVGEVVEIRFRDDSATTDYRRYRLTEKHFADEWDERTGRHTGTFVRLAEEEN